MATVEELEAELSKLRAEAASNDKKLRRAQRRELGLLRSEDLATLFAELTTELQFDADLDKVSLVVADPDHVLRHLLNAAGTPPEDNDAVIYADSLLGLAPQFSSFVRPWLGPFSRADHALILPGTDPALQSVAMIPIEARGRLVGSVNLGSADAARFTPDQGIDFLARFGVIAGCCLENVVNRARLLQSGFTDALTGWHNRRYLKLRLSEELARVSQEGVNLVCLMLDLDDFKGVNDTWGHVAGDAVLREVAQRIECEVRASDVAARYGGEEFIVLLPDTDPDDARRLAERIRQSVARSPIELPGGETTTVTASIGLAGLSPGANDSDLKSLGDSLVARADVALYTAKSEGRDRVVVAAA